MTLKSVKLTKYLFDKYKLSPCIVSDSTLMGKDKIHFNIYPCVQNIKRSMTSRDLNGKEIATMILNEDNPKTMDYYFMKLLGVQVHNLGVNYCGSLAGNIRSTNNRVTEAFGVLNRIRNYDRGQIYFVLDVHIHQIFPKSRSFRIVSRRLLPVQILNPKAGQKKQVTYGSGYVSTYIEPDEIMVPKHLVLYCRNAWERKGEVKPSRAKNKDQVEQATEEEVDAPEAIAEAVSVI
jgi:hypothetical protein